MSSGRSRSAGTCDLEHVQPVVEVGAKATVLDLGVEVRVGGGHHAHVDPGGLVVAQTVELALLERAQAAWPGWPGGIAPTSSRNRVPRSASRKRPSRSGVAPVNAPLRWPKNSLSHISRGMAAQFTRT